MESQLNSSKLENVSMIESSEIFHLPDVPEISEVLEPTGLSPLTSSLDQTLTLQAENMTIEELWTEASSPVSDRAIPLPPAPELNDFRDVDFRDSNTDTNVDSGALVQYGPFFPPSGTPALNNIFAETGDVQDDSTMGPLPGHTEIVVLSVGVCGLRNLGNTCFMAAGLQCLTATPPVLHHFLNLEEKGEKLPPPGSLMAHFSGLLCKMWSGKYSALKPTEFKQTLGVYHSQFKDYRQDPGSN